MNSPSKRPSQGTNLSPLGTPSKLTRYQSAQILPNIKSLVSGTLEEVDITFSAAQFKLSQNNVSDAQQHLGRCYSHVSKARKQFASAEDYVSNLQYRVDIHTQRITGLERNQNFLRKKLAEKPTLDTSFSIADDGNDMALLSMDEGTPAPETPKKEETKTASAASTACRRETAESPSSVTESPSSHAD